MQWLQPKNPAKERVLGLSSFWYKTGAFPSCGCSSVAVTLLQFCPITRLLLPLAVRAIPARDKSQVMHGWVECILWVVTQRLLQISQLPSWRYSGALCTCQQHKVGFLLCCVCNESKWKGTYWISNNSPYSPSGPQENEHDFLSYWALPSLDFCYFSIIFF